MNASRLRDLGVPAGQCTVQAMDFVVRYLRAGGDALKLEGEVRSVLFSPEIFVEDAMRGEFARILLETRRKEAKQKQVRWHQWGDGLDDDAVSQMRYACQLPIAVAGALMPDAHVGYGLPIGGVLATEEAVIPYAVGVDIACRMKLSVYDVPAARLEGMVDRLAKVLERETRFGLGARFEKCRNHEVMDGDWLVSPVTKRNIDKAREQLGTSGSGNHFVEFGCFTVEEDWASTLGLPAGSYLSLLSHSGSRGTGAQVCDHYSRVAMAKHGDLPKQLKHLAWLNLNEADGQEYWAAMQLMGRYAAANHEVIHRHVAKSLGFEIILDVENHHNFAWEEEHWIDGSLRKVVVHRKGATPAGEGILGIIPGSMASPGFLVRGRGNPASLYSASHGAGRIMSRNKARSSLTWSAAKKLLAERGVRVLSAGLDEVPMVYKDIHKVMAAQRDLVEVLARFDPRLVRMCPDGEKAED